MYGNIAKVSLKAVDNLSRQIRGLHMSTNECIVDEIVAAVISDGNGDCCGYSYQERVKLFYNSQSVESVKTDFSAMAMTCATNSGYDFVDLDVIEAASQELIDYYVDHIKSLHYVNNFNETTNELDNTKLKEKISNYYDSAFDLSIQLVEKLARQFLKDNSQFDEFVMAMGSWFFTYKVGVRDHNGDKVKKGNTCCHDVLPNMKEICDFIDEWDMVLKITGYPMRFTASGNVITDW